MINDPDYMRWLSDRMWDKNGFQLFTDGDETEVQRVAFQMSRKKEILIKKARFLGHGISLLYVADSDFPPLPTHYYYDAIDPEEGAYLYLADACQLAHEGVTKLCHGH